MAIDINQVIRAVERDDNIGICEACGAEYGGVEPDAHGYHCSVCDADTVTGAFDLLVEAEDLA